MKPKYPTILPWLIWLVVIAAVVCAWIYGWGGGDINTMNFDTDEVDRVELSSTLMDFSVPVAVTEPEDIQAIIDSANGFRHTGNELKDLFKDGLFLGGSVLYEFHVYLTDGEDFLLTFASHRDQPLSDTEVSYWVRDSEKKHLFSTLCRGSLEPFFELYEKYRPAE